MEAIAELQEDFAGLEEVRAAEGEAVVEQHAAIGDVSRLQVDGKSLAEIFTERKIEGSVGLKMVAGVCGSGISVRETGCVIDVSGSVSVPGQSELTAEVQRVALV